MKTSTRHQQLVSLSSMESELFALQSVAQEMSALGKLWGYVWKPLFGYKGTSFPGVSFTDSESSLKLLKNLEVKASRNPYGMDQRACCFRILDTFLSKRNIQPGGLANEVSFIISL